MKKRKNYGKNLFCFKARELPQITYFLLKTFTYTLFETENERQKTKPVPIPLPRASRNFPDVKTRIEIFFYNWTSEIIPFISFGEQMDGS